MPHDKPFSKDLFLLANVLVNAVFRSDDGLAAAEFLPTEEETTERDREGAAAKCSPRSKRLWPLPDRLHLPPVFRFCPIQSVLSAVHLHARLRRLTNPSHCRQQHSKIKNKKQCISKINLKSLCNTTSFICDDENIFYNFSSACYRTFTLLSFPREKNKRRLVEA